MEQAPKRRSLKNIKLTAHMHAHYLGPGILLTLAFLTGMLSTVNIMLSQRWDIAYAVDKELAGQLMAGEVQMVNLLTAQVVIFLVGLFALTVLTGHRVSGPYLALKRTFRKIREGDTNCRLDFRQYDKLNDVAEDFNSMMDALKKRMVQAQRPEEQTAEVELEAATK